MSWKTASEILVTDRWLRVRADSGALNWAGVEGEGREAFIFLYMSFIPAPFLPHWGSAVGGHRPGLASQGQDF